MGKGLYIHVDVIFSSNNMAIKSILSIKKISEYFFFGNVFHLVDGYRDMEIILHSK